MDSIRWRIACGSTDIVFLIGSCGARIYRLEAKNARSMSGRLGGQQPAVHGGPVVEARLGQHVEDAAGRAGLRVVGGVDHPRHARQDDRPRAHRARLERHVQHRVEQSPGAEPRRRVAQGEHLGVGRRVAPELALVARRGQHLALVDEHGSDRHVIVFERPLGLPQGQPHEVLVARKEARGSRSCELHNFPMVKLFLRSYTQQPTVTQCRYASSP